MFGNMTAHDIRRTIGFCTQLCAHGGTVIWTRNRREPDQVPRICDWFAEDSFAPVWVSDPAEGWGVGAHRFTASPVPLERGARMFRFIRRPPALNFHPERAGRVPPRTTQVRLGRPPGRVPAPGPPPTRRSGCVS
jgi:hypothetical protein